MSWQEVLKNPLEKRGYSQRGSLEKEIERLTRLYTKKKITFDEYVQMREELQ
jgi:hypothetical protein